MPIDMPQGIRAGHSVIPWLLFLSNMRPHPLSQLIDAINGVYSEQKNCLNVLLLFKDSKITQELLRLKT
jgi:hypothetical protein